MFFGLNDVGFLGSLQPPSTLLLDLYPNAAAAYSLRQLRAGVANVVRVRRSSDNTEADFTAAQVSDGSLATWVGAGNDGFVRTWYDQSGGVNHAVQSTTANQPQIISSGSLVFEGSKPALSFNGTSQFLQASSLVVPQPATFMFVAKKINTSHYFDGAISRITIFGLTNNISFFAGAQLTSSSFASNVHALVFATALSGVGRLHFNSALRIDNGSVGANQLSSLLIGRQTTGINFANQTMQELVIYPSDQSEIRGAMESAVNAHYAIY
jgi:hypothetical protein